MTSDRDAPRSYETSPDEIDGAVRRCVYDTLAATGRAPTQRDVAHVTFLAVEAIEASFVRLARSHVLVLDGLGEVLMAMPFSAAPTPFSVRATGSAPPQQWWANCAWDAFGIAAATGRDVEIDTDCPDCGEPLVLVVRDGQFVESAGIAHFAVSAAHWWDDIEYT
jgi:Alkylmercury lyase